jgi:DNA ligase-1
MEFSIISEIFEKMEKTSKRTELTEILVELLQKTPKKIIPIIVYLLQGVIRPNFEGIELGIAEKLAIRAISKSSGLPIKKIEDSYRDSGDLGITASNILKSKTQTTFTAEKITIERIYDTLFKIAKLEGKGSQDLKMKYISSLLNDATPLEAKFVLKILLGTLRLGIAENTVMDALAIAFTGKKENKEQIENAYNVSSDLGKVSLIVATNGIDEIKKFKISLFNPIRPMLADRAKSEQEVIKKMPELFAAEYKLDGERVQIHIQANKIILFSRRLENITQYYPDIVENVRKSLGIHEGVFEAEIVPINENTGEFLPFQELMHRRRKYNLDKAVSQYPITVNFFDVLYFDKKDCLNLEYSERRKILERVVNEDNFSKLIPMKFIKSENEIVDFLENSINAGCEGLMLKTPNAPYRAGARGSNWLKLKREYRNELGDSLDLIVIGAYFGRGKRTGLYGTLLLGTFNPETNNFPSICKVGTGFTDESLDQLYQILSNKVTLKKNSKIVSEMEADVWFEPELVLEIVASEITLSPIHKTGMDLIRKNSGFALRFPKFTGKIRYEKTVEDASTDEEVLALYKRQSKINLKNEPIS